MSSSISADNNCRLNAPQSRKLNRQPSLTPNTHMTVMKPSDDVSQVLTASVSDAIQTRPMSLAQKPFYDHDMVFSTASSWCLNKNIERISGYPVACGGFADIWKGSFGSLSVAIKVMRPFASNNGRRIDQKKLTKQLWHEFHSWSCLQHENVISCLGFSYDFTPDVEIPSLISPWMVNGTVKSYIETYPDVNRFELLIGVARGLSYLHNRDPVVVHGDIRTDNILVSDSGVPQLNDFGLSKVLGEIGATTTSTELAGSLRWMSPELLRGKPVSMNSDVWAYGMTALELLSGNRPWQEYKFDHMVLRQILDGHLPSRPKTESGVDVIDDRVWNIFQKCWKQKNWERPSMNTVMSEIIALVKSSQVLDETSPTHPRNDTTSPSLSWKRSTDIILVDNNHAFCPPSLSDSRGPCPGLNTLANHGYLPRDGQNVWPEDLLDALKNPETYRLSDTLARFLVYGGLFILRKTPPISLHDFTRRGQVEPEGEFVTLDDIARQRIADMHPDPIHQEMARGEWALVLDVFGRAHGGKVPSDLLRVWLTKNQFPKDWKPTHEQGLFDTVWKSKAIREKMNELITQERIRIN